MFLILLIKSCQGKIILVDSHFILLNRTSILWNFCNFKICRRSLYGEAAVSINQSLKIRTSDWWFCHQNHAILHQPGINSIINITHAFKTSALNFYKQKSIRKQLAICILYLLIVGFSPYILGGWKARMWVRIVLPEFNLCVTFHWYCHRFSHSQWSEIKTHHCLENIFQIQFPF